MTVSNKNTIFFPCTGQQTCLIFLFESLLIAGLTDIAQRYVDSHPPPTDVLTLEQAAVRIAAASIQYFTEVQPQSLVRQ